jgi:flavin reductase (DIM6/NTAB) family NADH-FMN oxidoreductase RutF
MKREIPVAQAHRLLAPRVTCLLTTQYRGQVNVMTLSWVCPISLEPPLVLMAIHPSCYTHDMLKRSQECVLNIPGRPLAEQIVRCGTLSGADVDKILVTGLALQSGRRAQVPWLDACLAHLECGIVEESMPGDHGLFIGQVLGAWAEEEAFDGVWLSPEDNEELQPLLHLGGHQFGILGKRVILP